MNKIILLIFITMIITQVNAVEIQQVLYTPNSTEAGGEAVELYNPSGYDVSLDGWTLATGVSDQDVTFPKNATINAHSYFLVADIGWDNEKDNSEWKKADYEETMTLTNANSGVLLKNKNGTAMDAVGWGDAAKIKTLLYMIEPAKEVKKGNSLVRITRTGNNSKDFIEQTPLFIDSQSITLAVIVEEETEQIQSFRIKEDDSAEAGTQIMPASGQLKNITVVAEMLNAKSSYVQFQDRVYALEKLNNSFYSAKIPLPKTLASGNYTIHLFAGQKSDVTSFTYLPLSRFEIMPKTMSIKAMRGKTTSAVERISVKNTGNVPLAIRMNAPDLKAKNHAIPASNIFAAIETEIVENIKQKRIHLLPGMQKELMLSINVPEDTAKENYSTIMRFSVE